MKRKVNCEKQEKCRVCKMCSWICSWFSQKDKQTSSDNPLDAFVPPENPMEMHIDMETPDFLKEDESHPAEGQEKSEEDLSQSEQETEQEQKQSDSLSDNKPFIKLFEECSSVIKDIDRLSARQFESQETPNVMQYIESKLLSALYLAGGQPIDNDTEFDVLRHSCIDKKDVPQSTPITETVRQGVILEDRVFVKANVRVDENYINAAGQEQGDMVRRCPGCGNEISSEGVKFCPICGRPLQGNTEQNEQTFMVKGVEFKMIKVEGGTFRMGATSEQEYDAFSWEKPVHSVTLSDYYIGETEVTQELWEAVMGSNPSVFKGNDQRPVENVSWDACQEFIKKLNQLTGKEFRLPTEAEWEYAARGGKYSRGYKYSGSNNADEVAWYWRNSGDKYLSGEWNDDRIIENNCKTHPVKTKKANELGLYDMSGNVYEWCNDWYDDNYYRNSPQTNPTGPSEGVRRVLRGGGWYYFDESVRVSNRGSNTPDLRSSFVGLRLAL